MKRDYTKFIDAESIPNGTRFCSSCYQHRNSHGGKYKIGVHGKSRRWLCSECYTNRVTVKKLK